VIYYKQHDQPEICADCFEKGEYSYVDSWMRALRSDSTVNEGSAWNTRAEGSKYCEELRFGKGRNYMLLLSINS
jgi:hypothetical protein